MARRPVRTARQVLPDDGQLLDEPYFCSFLVLDARGETIGSFEQVFGPATSR
jgi:hypothetical protein